MANAVATAESALKRALVLCRVLDREHDGAQVHEAFRAVRHELETAQTLLERLGADITAPREGMAGSDAPETSKAAARAMRTRSGSQRHRILRHLAERGPRADFQIQQALALPGNSQRPRRLELARAGYITLLTASEDAMASAPIGQGSEPGEQAPEDVITVKNPQTGLACEVWRITVMGQIALRKLDAGQMVLALDLGDGRYGTA